MTCENCGRSISLTSYPQGYLGPYLCGNCTSKKGDDGSDLFVLLAIGFALAPLMAIVQVLGGTSTPQTWGFNSLPALILVSIGAIAAPFNRWIALAFYGYGLYRLVAGYNPETLFYQKFNSNFGIIGIYIGSVIIYVVKLLKIGAKQLTDPSTVNYEYDGRKVKFYIGLGMYLFVISLQVLGVFTGNKPPQKATEANPFENVSPAPDPTPDWEKRKPYSIQHRRG
jgi:sulfur relay (sulfurtransferase) DsrF/TusC family protein